MQKDDMILISVDDHIIEPPHVFVNHLPDAYRARAPRVAVYPDGQERWIFNGKRMPTIAQAAVSGRRREELDAEVTRYAELRKGLYDIHARVADMNANGVLSSLCFPTLPGFAGEHFVSVEDKDFALALVRAYNDWYIDEWCAPYPGRFIPLMLAPLWDMKACVVEVARMAKRGVRAVCLPEIPSLFGLPSIHNDYWDDLFKACLEHDLVIAVHIASGGQWRFPSEDTPLDFANTLVNMAVAGVVTEFVYSPILRKFPTLRIAMSEGCVGWVPFLMERADAAYELHRFWTKQDFGDKRPSDYLRNNFLYCFHHDDVGLKYRHDVGVNIISWECDYPHADSTWPDSPEVLWKSLQGIPDDEIDLITHRNAMRYFNFDPFRHVPREKASVGALRAQAQAQGVDLSLTSVDWAARPEADRQTKVLTARSIGQLYQNLDRGLVDSEARFL